MANNQEPTMARTCMTNLAGMQPPGLEEGCRCDIVSTELFIDMGANEYSVIELYSV